MHCKAHKFLTCECVKLNECVIIVGGGQCDSLKLIVWSDS